MIYLVGLVVLIGHISLFVLVINRLHATALPYWFIKGVDTCWYLFFCLIPVGLVCAYQTERITDWPINLLFGGFISSCVLGITIAVPTWLRYIRDSGTTERLLSNHTRCVDIAERLQHKPMRGAMTTLLAQIPTNQIFQLNIHEKQIRLPRLDQSLSGLTIAHVSDLHFTGRLTDAFFEEVVKETNRLSADMIVITGDIIDKRPCLSWLSDILGKLESRHGVYFVLGNHDLRIRDDALVRKRLTDAGLIDLGGRWEQIEVNGRAIQLAGNELPWFSPAANMNELPESHAGGRPLRIVLSHSPDQLEWARRHDVDLLLAGHTHGGQIRFPVIGPVFSPSHFGVRFCAGTFYEEPTLMHVSRGVSGTRQIRVNCPPELAKLELLCEA